MLDARLAHPTRTDPGASTLADIVWAATVSGRYAPGATCLTRALVARRLLLRRGIPASVEIGVHLDSNGQVRGHAWVVSHGAIVLGGEESARQYIALGL